MPVQFTCEMCGATFAVPPSRAALGEVRFCSMTCYDRERCAPVSARLLRRGVRQPNGCLLWPRGAGNGYGRITVNGRLEAVHVMAYREWVGPIPDGHQVQHLCDVNYPPGDITNRRCFEPTHLTTGTHEQNLRHAAESGRAANGDRHAARLYPERVARGSRHGSVTHPERLARGDRNGAYTHPETRRSGVLNGEAKLADDDVLAIRARVAAGERAAKLARLYGISKTQMSRIVHRQSWKHLD